MYNQDSSFYSDKEVQKLLKDIGVVVICGVSGAVTGFAVAGPTGAFVGGVVGTLAGLIIIEAIEMKSIRFDCFWGAATVNFVIKRNTSQFSI